MGFSGYNFREYLAENGGTHINYAGGTLAGYALGGGQSKTAAGIAVLTLGASTTFDTVIGVI